MSKEKGTAAAPGTGSKEPVIQKLHMTGERNVKLKLNRRAAKLLMKGDKSFRRTLSTRLQGVL